MRYLKAWIELDAARPCAGPGGGRGRHRAGPGRHRRGVRAGSSGPPGRAAGHRTPVRLADRAAQHGGPARPGAHRADQRSGRSGKRLLDSLVRRPGSPRQKAAVWAEPAPAGLAARLRSAGPRAGLGCRSLSLANVTALAVSEVSALADGFPPPGRVRGAGCHARSGGAGNSRAGTPRGRPPRPRIRRARIRRARIRRARPARTKRA